MKDTEDAAVTVIEQWLPIPLHTAILEACREIGARPSFYSHRAKHEPRPEDRETWVHLVPTWIISKPEGRGPAGLVMTRPLKVAARVDYSLLERAFAEAGMDGIMRVMRIAAVMAARDGGDDYATFKEEFIAALDKGSNTPP